jgi:hypothetical protein
MSKIIKVKQRGKFKKANIFFDKMLTISQYRNIEAYAKKGVEALRAATPKDTGLTANSWYYNIEKTKNGITIEWLNSNKNGEYNIALLIQYGHGTRTGEYVAGIDYINPALRPIFDEISENAWREVNRS